MQRRRIGAILMAKKSAGRPGMPYADLPLTRWIADRIDAQAARGKTARQIAVEVGYPDQPNMISMFKRGEAKIPLGKIPLLARSLRIDPGRLFRLAAQIHWPESHQAIIEIFRLIPTENETKIIELIRKISADSDPELSSALEAQLEEAFRAPRAL
jgi:hypothetical protein